MLHTYSIDDTCCNELVYNSTCELGSWDSQLFVGDRIAGYLAILCPVYFVSLVVFCLFNSWLISYCRI
jgi:hypothetical protein